MDQIQQIFHTCDCEASQGLLSVNRENLTEAAAENYQF